MIQNICTTPYSTRSKHGHWVGGKIVYDLKSKTTDLQESNEYRVTQWNHRKSVFRKINGTGGVTLHSVN